VAYDDGDEYRGGDDPDDARCDQVSVPAAAAKPHNTSSTRRGISTNRREKNDVRRVFDIYYRILYGRYAANIYTSHRSLRFLLQD